MDNLQGNPSSTTDKTPANIDGWTEEDTYAMTIYSIYEPWARICLNLSYIVVDERSTPMVALRAPAMWSFLVIALKNEPSLALIIFDPCPCRCLSWVFSLGFAHNLLLSPTAKSWAESKKCFFWSFSLELHVFHHVWKPAPSQWQSLSTMFSSKLRWINCQGWRAAPVGTLGLTHARLELPRCAFLACDCLFCWALAVAVASARLAWHCIIFVLEEKWWEKRCKNMRSNVWFRGAVLYGLGVQGRRGIDQPTSFAKTTLT